MGRDHGGILSTTRGAAWGSTILATDLLCASAAEKDARFCFDRVETGVCDVGIVKRLCDSFMSTSEPRTSSLEVGSGCSGVLDGLSLRLALDAPADGGGVWTATTIESTVHGAVRGTALDEGTMGLTYLGRPFGSVLARWGQV